MSALTACSCALVSIGAIVLKLMVCFTLLSGAFLNIRRAHQSLSFITGHVQYALAKAPAVLRKDTGTNPGAVCDCGGPHGVVWLLRGGTGGATGINRRAKGHHIAWEEWLWLGTQSLA